MGKPALSGLLHLKVLRQACSNLAGPTLPRIVSDTERHMSRSLPVSDAHPE